MTLKRPPLNIFQTQKRERLIMQTKLTGYFHPKIEYFFVSSSNPIKSFFCVFHFIWSSRKNGLNDLLCTGRFCARSYDAVNCIASECHLKFPENYKRFYTATLTQMSVSKFCDNGLFFYMAKYKILGYLSTRLSSKKVLYFCSVEKFWIRWYKN